MGYVDSGGAAVPATGPLDGCRRANGALTGCRFCRTSEGYNAVDLDPGNDDYVICERWN